MTAASEGGHDRVFMPNGARAHLIPADTDDRSHAPCVRCGRAPWAWSHGWYGDAEADAVRAANLPLCTVMYGNRYGAKK